MYKMGHGNTNDLDWGWKSHYPKFGEEEKYREFKKNSKLYEYVVYKVLVLSIDISKLEKHCAFQFMHNIAICCADSLNQQKNVVDEIEKEMRRLNVCRENQSQQQIIKHLLTNMKFVKNM